MGGVLNKRNLLINIGLMLGGTAIGIIAVLLILNSGEIQLGGTRFIFTDYNGDNFAHQQGLVRPPATNRILEDVVIFRDADGFRRPALTADSYPIIAIGDSFTDGGQTPWVDYLAQSLNTPVRNLGWRGFGPLEYVAVMRDYGGDDHQWILIAFFEGNDLGNIATSHTALKTREMLTSNATAVPPDAPPEAFGIPQRDWYLYPLTHANFGDIAYLSSSLWWLNGTHETYQQSQNMRLLGDALSQIQAMAGDACLGFIYIPSKEHLYFSYADPMGNRQYVLQNGGRLVLDEAGWLSISDEAVDYTVWDANKDNLHDVIADMIADMDGWTFIDLLPTFENRASMGILTYYEYDSHWNDAGHQLAGETIADVVRRGCE
ncbi:MAG: hypothetical protein CUN52_07715 [Phototrophicales bacterium]|nr:MAG: hypothetical protein CUN52_07715 [Phototrophicales bacterium]